jgi:HD-GYP domain-containing protein (c-di-GMP phosphodiesterase class II)
MTSDRPYRAALSHEVAVSELVRGRGSQFDAAIVDAFLALDPECSLLENRPAQTALVRT